MLVRLWNIFFYKFDIKAMATGIFDGQNIEEAMERVKNKRRH